MFNIFRKPQAQFQSGDVIALRRLLQERAAPLIDLDLGIVISKSKSLSSDQADRLPVVLYDKVKYYFEKWCFGAVCNSHELDRLAGKAPNQVLTEKVLDQRADALLPLARQIVRSMCEQAVQSHLERQQSRAMEKVERLAQEEAARTKAIARVQAHVDGWKAFLTGDASKPPRSVAGAADGRMWEDLAHAVLKVSKAEQKPLTIELVERLFPHDSAQTQRSILTTAIHELDQGQRLALAA